MKKLLLTAIIFFLAPTTASAATFTWSDAAPTLDQSATTTLTLTLDTTGTQTSGTDVVFNFDPAAITIQSVNFVSPNLYSQNFYTTDTTTGTLRLTSSATDVRSTFTGSQAYAQLIIQGNTVGSTNLSFSCTAGQTNDTNIVAADATDAVDCSSLTSAQITVTASTQPAASPSPSPSPSPSATTQTTTTTTSATGGITVQSPLPNCARPATPTAFTAKTQSSRSILLSWKGTSVDHYAIQYGPSSNDYRWGAANIGAVNQFLVENLSPGATYYFSLVGFSSCGSSSLSVTASAPTTSPARVATTPSPVPLAATTPKLGNIVKQAYAATDYPTKTDDKPVMLVSPKPSAPITVSPIRQTNLLAPFIGLVVILAAIIAFIIYRRSKRSADPERAQRVEGPPPLPNPPTV